MGDVIQFKPNSEPGALTRKALFKEAVEEYKNILTDEEVEELRAAMKLNKRDEIVAQLRKQCIVVNTFLHELLSMYRKV